MTASHGAASMCPFRTTTQPPVDDTGSVLGGTLEGKFAVHLDLGIQGLGILLGLSLVYGAFAGIIFGRSCTYWVGPIAAVAAFVVGFFMSEVVMGTMTVDEIQPIIDGLAFDEAMLGGLLAAVLATIATWATVRYTRGRRVLAR